ncbi:MAG: ABC transporter permease, partial [Terriglobia bacterium]
MGAVFQDVKFGLRMLAKNPGFTAVAVITLALGIGANTVIFSVADAFLLRPVALPQAGRLVAIAKGTRAPTSPADFLDWEKQSRSFD